MECCMQCNCKDCKKREIGCHGKCEEYKRFYKERRDINEKRRKINSIIYKDCSYNRGYDT